MSAQKGHVDPPGDGLSRCIEIERRFIMVDHAHQGPVPTSPSTWGNVKGKYKDKE
jgi:hypothetical protein